MLSVGQQETETVPATKIHDTFRFGLDAVVEHVGKGLNFDKDEMP